MAPSSTALNLKARARKLSKKLRSADLEGAIVAPGPNLTYYTGVKAHLLERPFLLLIQSDDDDDEVAHLIAPKLETGPFRDSVPITLHEWDDSEGPSRAFDELVGEIHSAGMWGCEGRVPFGFLDHLLTRGLKVRPADTILQSIRELKEPEEIELIKKSARILSNAILKVPGALREGMTEKELSRFIVEDEMAAGADEIDAMVQSGPRAADPHSNTSLRRIRRGESVVVDVVSSFAGYAADITRTFMLGKDGRVERVYKSVLAAHRKAIEAAEAGVTTGKVDAAARSSLEADGLSSYFIHRTGHGLGLEVHEAPFIVSGGRENLAPGMVFTVEPGVYIPGRLGVRIEDGVMILGKSRREVVTSNVPTEYGWWSK